MTSRLGARSDPINLVARGTTTRHLAVGGPIAPFGVGPTLPSGGFTLQFSYPPALVGVAASVMMQALVLAPDPISGNGIFLASDGHELTDGS